VITGATVNQSQPADAHQGPETLCKAENVFMPANAHLSLSPAP
jgi:hypothetical protein